MKTYFPLSITEKVKQEEFDWYLPSKTFTTWKNHLIYTDLRISQYQNEKMRIYINILFEIYLKFKQYMDGTNKVRTPNIIKCLCKIIPMAYFGSLLNRKRFIFIVKRILTQNRDEFIHTCALFEKFDYSKFQWLNEKEDIKTQVLQTHILLLQTVVKPLIRHHYSVLSNFCKREMQLIPKGDASFFSDTNIANSIKLGYMSKVQFPLKKCHLERLVKLRFVPKNGVSRLGRPIAYNCPVENKEILQTINMKLKRLTKKFQIGGGSSVYEKWKAFVKDNKESEVMYAVKLDLFDAFGMVEVNKLMSIINGDDEFLTQGQKDFLNKIVLKQYIRVGKGKQIYEWKHGLLQGKSFSPILCDLYLSYVFYECLKDFVKPGCFFHRMVDDILFVTTSESEVDDFAATVCATSVINKAKTKKFCSTADDPPIIVFCGKTFNLATRETGTPYEFEKGTDLRNNFKFWNAKKVFNEREVYEFIVHSMKFAYVNFYFSSLELNTVCNQVRTVLNNIFDGMCLVGLKLLYAIESVEYLFKDLYERVGTTLRCIDFVVSSYTPAIRKGIKKYRGRHYQDIFSRLLIKFICLRAFIVVLNKKHFNYKEVIAELKSMLKRIRIPNLNEIIDVTYFCKPPKWTDNISMHRKVVVTNLRNTKD